jgi:hypothetical protein
MPEILEIAVTGLEIVAVVVVTLLALQPLLSWRRRIPKGTPYFFTQSSLILIVVAPCCRSVPTAGTSKMADHWQSL